MQGSYKYLQVHLCSELCVLYRLTSVFQMGQVCVNNL